MGDRGTREDDLTVAVGQIVEANSALQQQLARGFPRQILEAWDPWTSARSCTANGGKAPVEAWVISHTS